MYIWGKGRAAGRVKFFVGDREPGWVNVTPGRVQEKWPVTWTTLFSVWPHMTQYLHRNIIWPQRFKASQPYTNFWVCATRLHWDNSRSTGNWVSHGLLIREYDNSASFIYSFLFSTNRINGWINKFTIVTDKMHIIMNKCYKINTISL